MAAIPAAWGLYADDESTPMASEQPGVDRGAAVHGDLVNQHKVSSINLVPDDLFLRSAPRDDARSLDGRLDLHSAPILIME
jgi:hypothetical protein